MPKGIVKAPCVRTCHSFSEPGGLKNQHTSDHRLSRCSATCNATWDAMTDRERSGNNKLGK